MKLTDFGIARPIRTDNGNETSGTPGYMAPEVMCRQNHGKAVDYYAMGVIGYECMFGRVIPINYKIFLIRDLIMEKIEKKLETLF